MENNQITSVSVALCGLFVFLSIFATFPNVSAQSDFDEINNFLENSLGNDFMNNYVGEPIVNPVLDPNWDSFDIEKAKMFLNKDSLTPAKSVLIYPIQIDNTESSFRVIIFEDDSFYSELTIPVNVNIGKDEAIKLAEDKGIKEPYNIILMTNDDFFGWSIITTKDLGEISEGEISQVTIDLRSNNISSNVYNQVRYNEKSKLKTIIISAIAVFILAIIVFKIYRRKDVKKN